MTTLHTGDEDDEDTLSAEDTEETEQSNSDTEETISADLADEPEPAEQNESSHAMERSLPAPTPFNADASDLYSEWKHWMNAFEIYSSASGLATKADEVQ